MIKVNGKEYLSVSLAIAADKDMYDGLARIASVYAQGEMLPAGVKNAHGALALMLYGADYGLSPNIALRAFSLIGGSPSMKANTMLAIAMRDGGVTMELLKVDDEEVLARFRRPEHPDYEVGFTFAEAKKAGLPDKNQSWSKYRKEMLIARVISRGLRHIAADILTGMYSQEELADGATDLDFSGDLNDVLAQSEKPLPATPSLTQQAQAAPKTEAKQSTPPTRQERKATDVTESVKAAVAPVTPAEVFAALAETPGVPAREQESDQTPGVPLTTHIQVVTVPGTKNMDMKKTTLNIMKALSAAFNDGMAKGMITQKLKELGCANGSELIEKGPLVFIGFLKWADDAITAQQQRDAEEAAAASAEPEVKDFEPNRQKAAAQEAVDFDAEIMRMFDLMTEANLDAVFAEVVDEFGYDQEESSTQVKRLTLEALRAKLSQAQAA